MEYDKSPAATTFSRKMSNRTHSLSFSANAVYDGVFASPASTKSPLVDYSEIFRASGPSPSSIPFLDVPELNGGKVKVDVRSSNLDYSSVFGGFGACDFAFTPKEVIIKSPRKTAKNDDKRNRRKGGSSSDVPLCNEAKNLNSSPEMIRMKHSDLSHHQTGQRNENGTTHPSQVPTVAGPTQLVDNMSPLQKNESKTPVPSVEKKPCSVGVEEVKASRKRSSKTEVGSEKLIGRNECSMRDNSTCKTDSSAEHLDVKPPSSLHRVGNGENGASERLMGLKLGISGRFQTEDDDSPGSPSYFDAETDVNSSAAESSAALKKAIEEAQVRMNIAKQMMERKKSGFRSSAKPKSCDEPKVEIKEDITVEGITEEIRDNNSQILGELVNSSEQSCSNEGDQHAKRARKLWEVPEGILKPTSDHTREELEEQELVKMEEEHARRDRKHWELPGGIFKSVMNSKQQEPENLAPAKPETDMKQEVQPLTENPFYTFGQLGSKIKCVVEAFTGSKVSQKDEPQVIEKENSILPQLVQGEQSDSHEMLPATREVEETPQETESKRKTKIEEKSESIMCTLAEGCSQKMDRETGWQVESACEFEDGSKFAVKDVQENPDPTYNFLDREGEKEIVSRPQEIFVGPDDTNTYVKEVEVFPTPDQSLSKTQCDESVGTMVSFATENTPEPGNIHEETGHKAPRRRRVWKTSEDVYNMIKAPKGNNRPWQLESGETETTQRSFQMEGVKIRDPSEETESTSEQANDSGLQENWTVLKQMFRQMFQTADTTKGEDETYCLLESEKEYIDIHQKAGDENGKEPAETSYCQTTGTNIYEQNEVETEYEAYAHTRENEDLESAQERYYREEDGRVEVQGKTSLVRELIGEELKATGMASDQEGEDVPEVFQESGWDQGFSELDEINERAEILEYDRSETDSNKSDEMFEQRRELADEIKIDGSIDTDTSRSSFEIRQGDSYAEEVGVEQDLSDQFHEKNSAASSTEEHVEEIDSDSIQSGWSVVEDDDKIKSYVEVSLAGHLQDQGASKPEELEETKEEADEMKTSLGEGNNENKTEQEHPLESQKEGVDRSNVEPAESSCCLPKGDEKIDAATDRNIKDNEGVDSCRSSTEEEGDATSDASQNEAERVEKHLKKKDEAKEKEREREKERFMVERAIREARERAFADARERAGKAAMEKAKAGVPRRGTFEVPKRSEKGSVEVNDKLSSAEKVSMQAKLRAERAAVERALSEARERALEKALSGKSAASQTRSYGGSKSFGSSGDRRGPSSSGTENKNSGPSSSSNQTAKGEPIQRCKARSERHHRTSERAAEALAEKKLRDLKAQKEQAERNRLAESLDADVKRWSNGKESNLRALLSTLQYILGAESGWKPIPLTDLVSSASVRKAYRKATLYVHPDKLQQRGASTQQKYICEKVFDLLKEAWNKFGADER
ncbi:auxilin-like protein 1 isoform X2 [Eutrema salsugineum]|uniref:auxilin-like protein 1 isoform X2 n=1 Tax=Eutrema salsugineum TaxID=72664 RepID=UPI000CED6EF5|nr:auxilin-like protein 1 isoform X2 [Eutrema salsugineum]